MSNFERILEDIQDEGILDGVNRYNPNNLEVLEEFLQVQVDENRYHSEANLTILKLYQLNPMKFNVEVVAQVLLKALMALPKSDFVLAKCLMELPKKSERENNDILHRDPKLNDILLLGDVIEACEFETVWDHLSRNKEITGGVIGFEEAIRHFVCHTVNITFQTLNKSQLLSLLDEEFAELAKEYNWKVEADGMVTVHNHEDTVKSRNIEEKLEFSHIKDILRQEG